MGESNRLRRFLDRRGTGRHLYTATFICLFPTVLAGCAVHYLDPDTGAEHVWGFGHLVMKVQPSRRESNLGLDLDTKPPTMELSISRREVVFAPTYPGGKTPPFYADFSSRSGAIKKFLFGLSSTFAGGEAAVEVSKKSAERIESESR
ncbi:MAG: hypothetical protein ACREQA_13555 [Candidatus Binatia bacterium]